VERELLLTGIGGQGIQLAAQVLARAAIAEGRSVQMVGSYGGMMRGGNTEATVVLADGAIEAPPTFADAWSAVFMCPTGWFVETPDAPEYLTTTLAPVHTPGVLKDVGA